MGSKLSAFATGAQCALVGFLLCLIAVQPPAIGPMLVIPIQERPVGALLNKALNHGAYLLGPGPVAGSVVVVGRLADLGGSAFSSQALILAAPSWLCDPAVSTSAPKVSV